MDTRHNLITPQCTRPSAGNSTPSTSRLARVPRLILGAPAVGSAFGWPFPAPDSTRWPFPPSPESMQHDDPMDQEGSMCNSVASWDASDSVSSQDCSTTCHSTTSALSHFGHQLDEAFAVLDDEWECSPTVSFHLNPIFAHALRNQSADQPTIAPACIFPAYPTPEEEHPPRRRRRDSTHIRRPPNAFMIWRSRNFHRIRTELQEEAMIKDNQAVNVRLGQVWKSLSIQDRKEFVQLAEEAKAKHAEMYPDYKYCPKRNKTRKA